MTSRDDDPPYRRQQTAQEGLEMSLFSGRSMKEYHSVSTKAVVMGFRFVVLIFTKIFDIKLNITKIHPDTTATITPVAFWTEHI